MLWKLRTVGDKSQNSFATESTLNFSGPRTGEYGPLNWPITACVLTKRYNKDKYDMMHASCFSTFSSTCSKAHHRSPYICDEFILLSKPQLRFRTKLYLINNAKYSLTILIRTQLFQIPCYFKLITISIGYDFRSFIYIFYLFIYLFIYLLATRLNSKMITKVKEDNKLMQIKKRGKRKKTRHNIL